MQIFLLKSVIVLSKNINHLTRCYKPMSSHLIMELWSVHVRAFVLRFNRLHSNHHCFRVQKHYLHALYFYLIAWTQCVMSAVAEHRLETGLWVLPLFAPLSPLPLPHIRFMCCWLPKSRSSPRAFTFSSHMVWSNHLLCWKSPNSHFIAPCACLHVYRYVICVVCACKHIQTQNVTHAVAICKHTHILKHTCPYMSYPAFLPWSPFDWQCLLQQGIMVENRGVEVLGRGEGVWGRSKGEWERGLGD